MSGQSPKDSSVTIRRATLDYFWSVEKEADRLCNENNKLNLHLSDLQKNKTRNTFIIIGLVALNLTKDYFIVRELVE